MYDGKPQTHDLIQTVENDALRQRLGLPKGINGVMVAQPYRDDPSYPLKEWDVITKIGDTPVDSDGKVEIRYDLRLRRLIWCKSIAKNGRLPLTDFAKANSYRLIYRLRSHRELVIPYLLNANPRYFIFGPFVFSQTTQDYLERLGNQRPTRVRPAPESSGDPALRPAGLRR